MVSFLEVSRRYLLTATQVLALVGFGGIVAMCLITMYDGLARYFWLTRVPGFKDFGEVIFAILIACCFPIGLLRNQNITITFLGTAWGKRAASVLNLFSALATLLGFAILTYAVLLRADGLGGRMTRTGVMMVAPWAWGAATIMASALFIQGWVVLALVAEMVTGVRIVDDHAGVTEGGIEEGFAPNGKASQDAGWSARG